MACSIMAGSWPTCWGRTGSLHSLAPCCVRASSVSDQCVGKEELLGFPGLVLDEFGKCANAGRAGQIPVDDAPIVALQVDLLSQDRHQFRVRRGHEMGQDTKAHAMQRGAKLRMDG